MSRYQGTWGRIGWLAVSIAAYGLLGYEVPRSAFGYEISLYGWLCIGYGWQLWPMLSRPDKRLSSARPDWFLFRAAILFRLLLLGTMPQLSDDYARFIWDGRLLAHGYNPYLYLPARLLGTLVATDANLSAALFQSLNSPHYFTVYPPVSQALFGLAAWLSPDSILGNVIALRVPILLAEGGTVWLMVKLLQRANRNPNLALLYALNPLVILELTGNLHGEAIMIFFVLLAVWLWQRDWFVLSAGALALAIGTKFLPVILFPLLLVHLGWRRGVRYTGLTGLFTVLLFLPFVTGDLIRNIGSSLGLYMHTFGFNASIYPLVRATGHWLTGSNTSTATGVGLSVLTLLGAGGLAWRWGHSQPGRVVVLTLTLYFLLTTTVHPWYITSLVAGTVFTQARYPLLWAGVVWLSYSAYQARPYGENNWLILVEYVLFAGFAVWERIINVRTIQ